MGVYRRKIVRRIPGNSEQSISGCEHGNESIISEDYETTLLWSVLGYGLTWIQCRSFGVVLPSLSTFPLVHNFCREVHSALASGTIQDFQNLLHRGVIHPFSLDSDGQSLLHVRPLCCLLSVFLILSLDCCIIFQGRYISSASKTRSKTYVRYLGGVSFDD